MGSKGRVAMLSSTRYGMVQALCPMLAHIRMCTLRDCSGGCKHITSSYKLLFLQSLFCNYAGPSCTGPCRQCSPHRIWARGHPYCKLPMHTAHADSVLPIGYGVTHIASFLCREHITPTPASMENQYHLVFCRLDAAGRLRRHDSWLCAKPGVTLMFSRSVMHSDCFCSKSLLFFFWGGGGGGACIWLVLILAILQVGCLSEIHVYSR